jgi:oligopeptide/dipeptide ABC transporter ATP-binding protein
MDEQTILEVENLHKHFPFSQRISQKVMRRSPKVVHAVDGVSFSVKRGEILALVGESGSGKTTVGMNVLGLQDPTDGNVVFDGYDVAKWSRGKLDPEIDSGTNGIAKLGRRDQIMALRRRAQMIFQDPYASLNPRQKVVEIVEEPLEIHQLGESQAEKKERVRNALEISGLAPADHFWERYPDGLSGGQRQRVVIAGALVLEPELLIADEPVSMLDVSIRAEILNLLLKIRDDRNITILYTTHDLATAAYFTDRMAVMYLGRIVEIGPTRQVIEDPQHPYTQSLISVIPAPNPLRRRQRVILKGEVPNPIDIPSGCRFHPRCPVAIAECKEIDPDNVQVSPDHSAACLLIKMK